MPINTHIYGLQAFTFGDYYSAAVDKRRFTIIDNQLAFVSDLVGDGRILGWGISVVDENNLDFKVSSGSGIISRFVTRTYNDNFFSLTDNTTNYVYMRRRLNSLGGTSGFSNLASVTAVDTTPPAVPSGLSVSSYDYSQISLSWTENAEADFNTYVLSRSTNNIDYEDIASVNVNSYTDEDIEQDTIYYYKIRAIDISENESSDTSSLMIKSSKDMRQPLPPSRVTAVSRNGAGQILWFSSEFGTIDRYEVLLEKLDGSNYPTGETSIITASANQNDVIISDLLNNVRYKATVYSVSENEVYSEGIVKYIQPQSSNLPSDVDSVSVSYSEGVNDDGNVVMEVSWSPSPNAYSTQVVSYKVSLLENGISASDPVVVVDSFSIELQVLRFQGTNRKILPLTDYIVRVQSVGADDSESVGVFHVTSTPMYDPPHPISNPNISQQSDNGFFAKWDNSPSSILSHNVISVIKTDNGTGQDTVIVDDVNIGKSSTYLLSNSYFSQNSTYEFVVYAVDEYGNQGSSLSFSISTLSSTNIPLPLPPENQTAIAGDGLVSLRWDLSSNPNYLFYKIYRAPFTFAVDVDSFVLVDTVPSTVGEYSDFSIVNDTTYNYLITSVDAFGRESINPIQDDIFLSNLVLATPRDSGSFVSPDNLSVSQSAMDAIVSWDTTSGLYDGYEIFRSPGNKYEFVSVGNSEASDTSFTDEDALLENGKTYYYLVRKIRNESDLFVTESSIAPASSILLGKVTISNGDINIDEDSVVEILNLDSPIRAAAALQINAHKHTLKDDGTDNRIDLFSDVVIDDLSTSDYQNYFTDVDLSGSSVFVAMMNGTVNDAYFTNEFIGENGETESVVNSAAIEQIKRGLSPFLFEVDAENGRLSFEVALYSEIAISPFSSPPTVTLKVVGVNEVKGILPSNKVGKLSTSQVSSGFIDYRQVPSIHHDGRINVSLVPLQEAAVSFDGYNFEMEDTDKVFDDRALSFYDICHDSADSVVVSTSRGISISDDFGVEMTEVFYPSSHISKLIKVSSIDRIIGISNTGIYITGGDKTYWSSMSGTESAKCIRDILETPNGNVFVSTDVGVFKLEASSFSNFPIWKQLSILGPRSTESYGLFYNDSDDSINVSNEIGLFYSLNEGITWTLSPSFDDQVPLYSFVRSGGYTFAISSAKLFRSHLGGEFQHVSDIDCSIASKIVIFEDKVYISTDCGVFSSKAEDDIYNASWMVLKIASPDLNKEGNGVATAMSVVDNCLFLGMDQKLFFKRVGGKLSLQYENIKGLVPTVYVDGSIRNVGFGYQNSKGFSIINFNDKIPLGSVVSVAIQYKDYGIPSGGWTSQKYDSRLIVKVNDTTVADTKSYIDGDFIFDTDELSSLVLPIPTERNSNPPTAGIWKKRAEDSISRMIGLRPWEDRGENPEFSLSDNETFSDVVSDVYFNLERFRSQIMPDFYDSVIIPSLTFDISENISVDVYKGVLSFKETNSKYDKVNMDIIGSTIENIGDINSYDDRVHRFVEDKIEDWNSGLPSSMSRVQQVNLLKMGSYHERTYGGTGSSDSPPYQAKYIVPRNKEWYDVLNSTIDYFPEIDKDDIGISIPYATAISNWSKFGTVLVGGSGGLISIDSSNFGIAEITLPLRGRAADIRDIMVKNDIAYVLTDLFVFTSSDGGATWDTMSRNGLPNSLHCIGYVNNRVVVGGSDGVYFKASDQEDWSKAVSSESPVEVMIDPDFVFVLIDGTFYFSSDGFNYIKSGEEQDASINDIFKYKSIIFAATDSGLLKDDGTLYTSSASLSLTDTLDDIGDSSEIVVNGLSGDENKLVIGLADGRLGYLLNNSWEFVDTGLKSIHRTEIVDGYVWAFGYDLFMVYSDPYVSEMTPVTEFPIMLSTGAPL